MQIEKAYYWPSWLLNDFSHTAKSQSNVKLKMHYGKAQLKLWRALNIYDDHLDSGLSSITLIEANRYYRNFLKEIYSKKFPDYFLKWCDKKFLQLEEANKNELLEKKININKDTILLNENVPKRVDLKTLPNKSLVLAIAPAALLFEAKILETQQELLKINKMFNYILAAKQLADDACDWSDDLKSGLITPATLPIFKEIKKNKISRPKPELLNIIFCQVSAESTCQNILKLCQKAKDAMLNSGLNTNGDIFNNIILPLENSARKAINFKKML